jgi:hypothetical protein
LSDAPTWSSDTPMTLAHKKDRRRCRSFLGLLVLKERRRYYLFISLLISLPKDICVKHKNKNLLKLFLKRVIKNNYEDEKAWKH